MSLNFSSAFKEYVAKSKNSWGILRNKTFIAMGIHPFNEMPHIIYFSYDTHQVLWEKTNR
jgi:hypothetical protein